MQKYRIIFKYPCSREVINTLTVTWIFPELTRAGTPIMPCAVRCIACCCTRNYRKTALAVEKCEVVRKGLGG